MPQQAYRDSRNYNSRLTSDYYCNKYYNTDYTSSYSSRTYSQNTGVYNTSYRTQTRPYRSEFVKPNQKKINRNKLIHKVISLLFFFAVAMFIIPSMFNKYIKSIPHGSRYHYIQADMDKIVHPLEQYLANDLSLGIRTIQGVNTKNPKMLPIKENQSMEILKARLVALQQQFPTIHSSIYVWDYNDGNYVDINADENFSAASIIKLPVLVALFKNIELGQVSIYDEMVLTDYFRAEGSGSLQYKAENSKYSIDTLARLMITTSDNSATNMLMTKIGGMPAVNRQINDWGLANIHVNTWLPDMQGTNYITARDMGRLLYNIDNPKFLNGSSREKIFSYMSHVKNDRLIPAGLGAGAEFMHKTGDIGKMLGDAGIVYAPNGKKYIVVILANRPYNSVKGKEFIVSASELIYKYLVKS